MKKRIGRRESIHKYKVEQKSGDITEILEFCNLGI